MTYREVYKKMSAEIDAYYTLLKRSPNVVVRTIQTIPLRFGEEVPPGMTGTITSVVYPTLFFEFVNSKGLKDAARVYTDEVMVVAEKGAQA